MRWIVPLVVSVFVTFDDGRETFAQSAGDPALTSAALASRGAAGPTRFELVDPARTGVDFTMFWEPPDDIRPGQGIGSTAAAAGVAIGDYDGDGRPDLFLTRPFGGNRLYRNLGDFRFKDVTASAGLTAELDYEAWGPASSTSTTENRAGRENRVLTLTLVGQTGNPTAVGAMVTVEMDRGTAQTFELHAGGSYLSQSTNTLFVGLGEDGNAERITVRWPDGSESTHNVEPAANTIEIEQPGR